MAAECQAALGQAACIGEQAHFKRIERRQPASQVFIASETQPGARGDAAGQPVGAGAIRAATLADKAEIDDSVNRGAALSHTGRAGNQGQAGGERRHEYVRQQWEHRVLLCLGWGWIMEIHIS